MAQQTAVEWLFDEIPLEWIIKRSAFDALQQAKVMEKEQRIKDYNAGYVDAQLNHVNDAVNYVYESEYINNKEINK